MGVCVKLWRGEWKKNGEEEWHFHPAEGEIGTRVMIGEDETYESIEAMVRTRYSIRQSTPLVLTFRLPSWMLSSVAYKTPPTTITRTEDLCVLLNVRTSIADLALLITDGPKRVAEYEFLCRSSFTIGTTTYVVDKTQTQEAKAEYERLVYGNREEETQKVMDALFSEQSLMLFHRVTCEMSFADQNRPVGQTTNVPSTELIVLEDDDDVMYEANNTNLETGGPSHGGGGKTACLSHNSNSTM